MQKRTAILLGVLCVLSATSGIYYIAGSAMKDLADGGPILKSSKARPQPSTPRTSRSTSKPKPPNFVDSTLLLREFPGQAYLITNAHDGQLAVIDRSVDYSGSAPGTPWNIKATYNEAKEELEISITDEQGSAPKNASVPVNAIGNRFIDYAKLAQSVEQWSVRASSATTTRSAEPRSAPLRDPATLAVPEEIEALLTQVDIHRSFLAARKLHELIAASGESPERLAALVRAYSHLGDSTRHLYSAHHSIFFARAALFAERLARLHPNSPLGQAARGYAYSLHGQTMEARRAFAKARELASATGSPLPAWASLAEDLSHFRTRAIFDHIDGSPSTPLASYFMMLSVEFSGLNTVTVNAAKLALKNNPGSIRAMVIIEQNSAAVLRGMSSEHEAAEMARLAMLVDETSATASIRKAAADVVRAALTPQTLKKLFEEIESTEAEPGQLLSWGTYATIWRDEVFSAELGLLAFRLGKQDRTRELAKWWPLLKDHRFASMLAGFDATGKIGNARARDVAERIELLSYWSGLPELPSQAKQLNPTPGGKPWSDSYNYDEDGTTYDVARANWRFRDSDADLISILGMIKGDQAKWLADLCPDHPLALSELIVNRWHEYADRAPAIEREYGGNPQITFALARAYRLNGKPDEAIRLFEALVSSFPERSAYQMLAELYERRGEQEKWQAAMDKYLAESEDFGIDHAMVSRDVAASFMRMKRPDRALKYARASANGAPVGQTILAYCLTELGQYEEAEKVVRTMQQYHPASHQWYRWCRATGRGDLKAARTAALANIPEIIDADDDRAWNDLAVFYALEGDNEKAREYWQRDLKGSDPSAFDSIMLALLDIEAGDVETAKKVLAGAPVTGMRSHYDFESELNDTFGMADTDLRGIVYRVAIAEALRCLDDPSAVPTRVGYATAIINSRGKPFRATSAYFLGRLCELRGKNDDAIWWYRLSLDGEWTSSSMPLAAVALRRLEAAQASTQPSTVPAP